MLYRICPNCGSALDPGEKCDCEGKTLQPAKQELRRLSPYDRTKAQVYATGNRWAIDNFNATH